METIRLKTHIGSDGILKFEMPVEVSDVDADIEVTIHVQQHEKEDWISFLNRTYGSLAHDPIERPPELPVETREPIE